MHWRSKVILVARSIILRLSRRSRQVSVGEALASDENWIMVDGDQISQTAEPPVDEGSEPRPLDAIQQNEPPLPPSCNRLHPDDIEIFTNLPSRAGAFTDVWEGSLAGDRVMIKSYRLYSTIDPTPARMVKFRWHFQVLRFTDPPPVRNRGFTKKRWHVPCFLIGISSRSALRTLPANIHWLSYITSWNTDALGNI